MNRVLLYSIILVALFGVDAAANNSAMRRALTSVLVKAAKATQSAMVGTAGYMAGQR